MAYSARREIIDGIPRRKSKRRKSRLDNFRWRKPDARLVRAAAELCREIRRKLGWSPERLAEETGMMLVSVINAESGAAATSRMDRYSRVAEYLRDVGGDPELCDALERIASGSPSPVLVRQRAEKLQQRWNTTEQLQRIADDAMRGCEMFRAGVGVGGDGGGQGGNECEGVQG